MKESGEDRKGSPDSGPAPSERERRRAEALRANLRRRKQQARQRDVGSGPDEPADA
jgi:hypothetical protein